METEYDDLNYGLQGDGTFDFKRYLSLFISNWYWFASALFISLSIAYGINRWSEEMYTVSATLLIKDSQYGREASDLINMFPGTNVYRSDQNLKNEIGILKSFTLNYKVMEKLEDFHVVWFGVGKRGIVESRLYRDAPLIVKCDSVEKQPAGVKVKIRILSADSCSVSVNGENNSVSLAFGDTFNEKGFDFRIIKNPEVFSFDPSASNKYYFYFTRKSTLANRYRSKLQVNPIAEEATLVTLSSTGPVREQEADYLNSLIEEYNNWGLSIKNEIADKTIDFIDKQIELIADSLRRAENSLEEFRQSNRLVDLSNEGTFIRTRLENLENEKNSLKLQKQYYEYLQTYVSSKNETGDIISPGAMGVNNRPLEELVSALASLQQQLNKLKMNIAENMPVISVISGSINDTRRLIAENIRNSLLNIDNAVADLEQRIAQVERELNKLPETERMLLNFQRKFDLNNTVYNYLLEKKAETGIIRASNVSDNRPIDKALPYNATKIRPKTRQNYSMAIAFGILLPAVLILLIDYLNNKVIDKKDIERGTRTPVIGYISHNKLKTEIPVVKNPGTTLAEAFRSVRTNLKYFLKDSVSPVISVSSTITAEGKTFISANLAAIIAMNGKKVLLAGLDLRKPRIHKILGLGNDTGISIFLSGGEKFENIIFETGIENLWYAPSGPEPPNPAELIDSKEMTEFINEAKKRFDYIVIDTPPVAVVTDALLIAGFTDLYVFVIRQRYSSKETLGLIEDLRKRGQIKNLGIILNDVSITGYYGYGLRYGYVAGYGYSYGYSYYGGYGSGKYGYRSGEKESYFDE